MTGLPGRADGDAGKKTELSEGDTVRLTVKVENVSGTGQGMAVAIIGLPAGLNVPEDLKQLKEHCRLPAERQTALAECLRDQRPGAGAVLARHGAGPGDRGAIDLVCRVPGDYRGPASRAYLYYNADKKHWIEPLAVTIAAKAE